MDSGMMDYRLPLDKLELPAGATVCHTHDLEEARSLLSSIYCPYAYKVLKRFEGSPILIQEAKGRDLALSLFSYGSEVEIIPQELKDFVLITFTIAGTAVIRSGGEEILCREGTVVVLSPNSHAELVFDQNNIQLTLRVEVGLLNRICHDLFGKPVKGAYLFSPKISAGATAKRWFGLIELYSSFLDPKTPQVVRDYQVERAEEMLGAFLLLDHDWLDKDQYLESCRAAGPTSLRRTIDVMEKRFSENITISDLCKISGVSSRSLQRSFEKAYQTTPMRYLHSLRLRNARDALLRAAETDNVTTIAMSCGFYHLGQFASDYKRTFGELPSQSLRAARSS